MQVFAVSLYQKGAPNSKKASLRNMGFFVANFG